MLSQLWKGGSGQNNLEVVKITERFQASVWSLSHEALIYEVLQILLSFRQVLPSQPRNSVVLSVVIRSLVTSLTMWARLTR